MPAASHPARPSSRSELLGDAALAVAVFALSLGLLAVSGPRGGHGSVDAVGVLLTALASLPLIVRRRAPLGVFVLTAVASAVLRGVAELDAPPLGPTVALYFLAAAGDARTRLTLALAAVLLVVHATAPGVTGSAFTGTPIAFGVLVWGGAWLAGDRARLRHERMAELEQRALRAEREAQRERRLATAEERTRIARDLHDSAGHAINVILVHAGLGRLRATQDARARETFQTIEDVARQTVAEIDQLVAAMREDAAEPDVEPPPGLAALDTLLQRHRAAGLDVTSTTHGDRRSLPPGVDRGAYRILQEALTNTARHGNGSAQVDIAFGPSALELTVANPVRTNGTARESRGGHGLIGMRERAVLLGGSLDTTDRNGRFCVHARLPLTSGGA
ncbi:MAG TPA: histidine kinase [Solirubrobacteraceae bacterium]|nr:histidine kinase [Solirubrobacteraceae bacterium]